MPIQSEREPLTSQELQLATILDFQPPIPHGRPDIDVLVEEAASIGPLEPVHAWERLPLWLARVEETYTDIGNIPIFTLDLGSSLPLYAQYLRTYEFMRDGVRARELVTNLFDENSRAHSLHNGEQGYLRPMHLAFSRDKFARALLAAGLQEFLYQLQTVDEVDMAEGILEKIILQQHTYNEKRERKGPSGKHGMRIEKVDQGVPYLQLLSELRVPTMRAFQSVLALRSGSTAAEDMAQARETQPAGTGLAVDYAMWQAQRLSKDMSKDRRRYKPARFLSFDSTDPREVALRNIAAMPNSTKDLHLFAHAIDNLGEPRQHLTGNMFEPLPFPDGSLALITCFDSWPYHFQRDETIHPSDKDFGQIALDTLLSLYTKLAPGGKMVIFPWAIRREDYLDVKADTKVLEAVRTEFGRQIGQLTYTGRAANDTLREWMSSIDLEIAESLSPLFDSKHTYYEALIVSKPKASSQQASQNWIGRIATSTQPQG